MPSIPSRSHLRPPLGALLLAGLLTGCLRPGEEQAELDLTVGHAEIERAALRIVDGRAAIYTFADGELVLWAAAPGFEGTLSIDRPAARAWSLRLRNVMPGATLLVDGAAQAPTEQPVPTEKLYRLDLDPGDHTLRLVPPAPEPGDDKRWRFAVLSDIQDAIDRADTIVARIEATPDLDFLVSAGDLTEQGEPEEYRRYQALFRGMSIPYYATPGNHERGVDPIHWTRAFGRASHSFPYRGARISFVDSSYGTVDPIVYGWLDDWLEQGRDAVHVVATHIPIMDPIGTRGGQLRSRNEAARLLVRLAREDVDLNLFGHVHSYYAFSLAGIPTYISGGGGALPERLDGIDRHFLVVEVQDGEGIAGVQVVRVD